MQDLAQGVQGRGQDINQAFGNLGPLAENGNTLLSVLLSQQGAVQRLVRNTGEVFTALSERDGQLTSLIRNANSVFQTTANRNAELQQTFIALPTFEREGQLTLDRVTRFALNTNPLITQLRPAARELSPTLVDLAALAPDLRGFFKDLNPLITASRRGLPALTQILDDARPLLGQFDPFLRQVRPILQGLTLYEKELTAFFANTVAATQATEPRPDGSGVIHYLRTSNPVNPENLAVYNKRLPSNRPNPYIFPGAFNNLPHGMAVYENRQCSAANVAPTPVAGAPLISPQLLGLVDQFALGNSGSGAVPAPPCVKQPPFPSIGRISETTQYPHVWSAGPPP